MDSSFVLGAWYDAARALLPPGVEVWDSHTHTGDNDPDGITNTDIALLDALDEAGHAGAVIMSSADLGGYEQANRRILDEAQRSNGRLIPYLRIDPRAPDAADQARRGLDGGFQGLKLHPRAEAFPMDLPAVTTVCEAAADYRRPVLVHAGRGIPPLGDAVLRLVDRFDGLRLILAHCGISDLTRLGPQAVLHPGLFFDSAWWDITDHLALAAWVPSGQILYASDTPYGRPELGFTLAMRTAAAARYSPAQVAAHFGGTLRRLVTGEPGEDMGGPPRDGFVCADAGLLRVHGSLQAALGAAFAGIDAREATTLGRHACDVAAGEKDEAVYRAIAATLDAIDPGDRRSQLTLLILAAAAALTPQVPVPDLDG